MVITNDFDSLNSCSIHDCTTMEVCHICNNKFKNLLGLRVHLRQKHNITGKEDYYKYLEKYTLFTWPICKYCNNKVYINSRGLAKTCSDKNCIHRLKHDMQILSHNTIEYKNKARINRINYLTSNNCNNDAWHNRARRKMSYLENMFYNECILKYDLQHHYNIINEYSEYPYFLDFAFIDLKIDVELDGKCHFVNGDKRIQHDNIRDDYLNSKGWKIFRISYYQFINDKDEIINKFLEYLKSNNRENIHKYDFNKLLKYNEYKKYILDELKNKKYKERENVINIHKAKIKEYLVLLENESNIDFTKFGWVEKSKHFLNNHGFNISGSIRRTIKLYYPEFFEHNNVFTKRVMA